MSEPSNQAPREATTPVYASGAEPEAQASESDGAVGKLRPHADNVFLMFLGAATMTPGGLHIPQQAKRSESRWARIVAVGPGHYNRAGVFLPTQVCEGQFALVDKLAGQDYAWDLTIPRHNKRGCEWSDDGASFRAVREDEIMAVSDEEPEA